MSIFRYRRRQPAKIIYHLFKERIKEGTYRIFLEAKQVQYIFRCTSQKCQKLFIASYDITGSKNNAHVCTLKSVAPITPQIEIFSESIEEISQTFIEIYNQALEAEAANLSQLVGIGLRKSIEFLIKDFAVNQNADKKEEIQKEFLGSCINQYIEDPNIKECAKRAVWLGNDETHYMRRWEDKDINDLKRLVKLTVNWIENVLMTQQYIKDMGDGGSE